LYAVGGRDDGPLATVEEYDPAANSWTTKTPMSGARRDLALAAAPNGKLYAVGGVAQGTNPCPPTGLCAKVEEYDPASNTWTAKAPMPTARLYLGLAPAPNGKLYAVGGADDGGALASVEEYDPVANAWATPLAPSTVNYPPRIAAAVTVANDRIYVFGGFVGSAPEKTAFEYTPATDTWRRLTDMPTGRSGAAAAFAANGKI
jgi:N-acetylneuraminic acid mutarotase